MTDNDDKLTYRVVSPAGEPVPAELSAAPRLDTLAGKTIGEISNDSFSPDVSFPIIRDLLRQRYPDIRIVPFDEIPQCSVHAMGALDKDRTLESIRAALIKKGCDAVITQFAG